MIEKLKIWAKKLKVEIKVLYLAYQDPRTPWYAKVLALLVVAYAVSPIDLIPDFIPVIGYLDDIILLPLGIILTLRMIPKEVVEDCRLRASDSVVSNRKLGWAIGIFVVLTWLFIALWLISKFKKSL